MDKQKSSILQMFYGEKGCFDSVKCYPGEDKLVAAVDKSYDLLCEKIKGNAEIKELFENYNRSLEKLHFSETEKYYAEGFKFGLLIGVEAGESKFND